MIAFEVTINGTRACTAGLDRMGVLSAILCYVKRQDTTELEFDVGSYWSHQVEGNEHLKYIDSQSLKPGDSVTIRIVEAAGSGEPQKRRRDDLQTEAERARAYRERPKRQYGLRDIRRPRRASHIRTKRKP
ncbi:MAG: putative integron cassette protein [Chthonomonadaceae bacterium]|nr:putative integron cassette protein [Chthonomonadaceae bacterium]